MSRRIVTSTCLVVLMCASLIAAAVVPASSRPRAAERKPRAQVVAQPVATGLNDPAGFAFYPDGRIVYAERGTGQVVLFNPATDESQNLFRIAGVDGSGERGALGIAVDPAWPQAQYLYVYVTRTKRGNLVNEIVREQNVNRKWRKAGVLMSQPASASPYHNGGRILFGPDGMLYAIVGDGHDSSNSQIVTRSNLRGKILRMTPAGAVPSDNPFARSKIFAFGIRNSFGFTFDPQTQKLWETENGPECNDELNVVRSGANYGWGPSESCQGSSPGNTNNSGPTPRVGPLLWFVSTIGITGDAFCQGCGLGASYEGELLFGDVNDGQIRVVGLNAARDNVAGGATNVLQSPNGAVYSMEIGPDGRIYFSDFGGIYRLASA